MFRLLRRNFLIVFCGLSGFISCNPGDKAEIERSASAFDIEQGRASILQANQQFMKSFKAVDSTGVANTYTSDAKLMPDHMEAIQGRDNIKGYMSSLMNKGFRDFELNTVDIWGDSSILAEEGTYTIEDTAGSQVDQGKYIVLWKPESGNWKMFRDMWTSNVAPADSVIEKE